MKYADFAGSLGRRIDSYFAAEDTGAKRKPINPAQPTIAAWKAMAELAAEGQRTYPEGWGTSPRRAPKATGHTPIPAKAYKPTHGGYPDAKQAR